MQASGSDYGITSHRLSKRDRFASNSRLFIDLLEESGIAPADIHELCEGRSNG